MLAFDPEYTLGKRLRVIDSPIRFGKIAATVRSLALEPGQHTEEVPLGLGYDWDDLSKLTV